MFEVRIHGRGGQGRDAGRRRYREAVHRHARRGRAHVVDAQVERGGAVAVRVEQVGGEVGAEALLCAAMWFAVRRGLRKERRFLIETPQGVRTVHANPLTGVVSAQVSERKTAYSTVRQTVALGPAYDLSF